MSQVTIVVTDKDDGTLSVAIQAEPDEGNSQAHQVSLCYSISTSTSFASFDVV